MQRRPHLNSLRPLTRGPITQLDYPRTRAFKVKLPATPTVRFPSYLQSGSSKLNPKHASYCKKESNCSAPKPDRRVGI